MTSRVQDAFLSTFQPRQLESTEIGRDQVIYIPCRPESPTFPRDRAEKNQGIMARSMRYIGREKIAWHKKAFPGPILLAGVRHFIRRPEPSGKDIFAQSLWCDILDLISTFVLVKVG